MLKAKSMVGKEGDDTNSRAWKCRSATSPAGEPGKATITADACRLGPGQERAVFQGSVHVVTEDGFELQSETLLYNGNKGVVKTADPVRFKRKTAVGHRHRHGVPRGRGAPSICPRTSSCASRARRVRPPTMTRGRRPRGAGTSTSCASMGNVRVVQGERLPEGRTSSTSNLNEELTAVYRAVAVERRGAAHERRGAPARAPRAPRRAKGPRVLQARKLDLWFRDDRTLKEATASPDADLLVMPGPGEPPEKRRVKAKVLAFRFDEQGRLVEMQAQRDALVSRRAHAAGRRASPAPSPRATSRPCSIR